MERLRDPRLHSATGAPARARCRQRGRSGRVAMNFSDPFILRPVGTTLLAIGLLLVGIVAYRFLPVASLPTVDFPTIRVSASRPGADPAIMAATVAAPLERRLGDDRRRHRDHLDVARSARPASRSSSTSAAASTARRATCRPRSTPRLTDLPADLPTLPTFRKANPGGAPVLILALTSEDDAAERDLRCGRHRDRAAHLAGRRASPRSRSSGAEQPAIRVQRRSGARSRRSGISLEDVRTAIANANAPEPDSAPFDGADAGRDDRHQRPAAPRPRIIAPHRRQDRQRQHRAAGRHRDGRAGHAQQPLGGLVQPPAGGAADHHQAGRRQRHRDGRQHPRR